MVELYRHQTLQRVGQCIPPTTKGEHIQQDAIQQIECNPGILEVHDSEGALQDIAALFAYAMSISRPFQDP